MTTKSKRSLKVSIERVKGTFNIFHVSLNGQTVIMTNGANKEWSGPVPDRVTLDVAAYGVGSSAYSVTIDLPGTAQDQKLECQLTGGYHGFTLDI